MTKRQESCGATLGGEPAHNSQGVDKESIKAAVVSQPCTIQGPIGFADQKTVTSCVPYPAIHVNHPVLKATLQHTFPKTFNFQISYGGKD